MPATDNYMPDETPVAVDDDKLINRDMLKKKADKVKACLVNKFKITMARIVTDAKSEIYRSDGKEQNGR